MSDHRQKAIEYAHQNRNQFINNLEKIVAIPSVSTNLGNIPDVVQATRMDHRILERTWYG